MLNIWCFHIKQGRPEEPMPNCRVHHNLLDFSLAHWHTCTRTPRVLQNVCLFSSEIHKQLQKEKSIQVFLLDKWGLYCQLNCFQINFDVLRRCFTQRMHLDIIYYLFESFHLNRIFNQTLFLSRKRKGERKERKKKPLYAIEAAHHN